MKIAHPLVPVSAFVDDLNLRINDQCETTAIARMYKADADLRIIFGEMVPA